MCSTAREDDMIIHFQRTTYSFLMELTTALVNGEARSVV